MLKMRFRGAVPGTENSHVIRVRIEANMKLTPLFALALFALTACTTQQRSPDEIRRETANATSAAARDAKAVAQGVADGLKHERTVNINKDSEKDLESLPGIDEPAARRIVDNRPYENANDLVKKHVLSKSQYDHIADKITAR